MTTHLVSNYFLIIEISNCIPTKYGPNTSMGGPVYLVVSLVLWGQIWSKHHTVQTYFVIKTFVGFHGLLFTSPGLLINVTWALISLP